jgi:hypothetical protein
MTRHLNRALLLLALVVGLPGWWLLVENDPGTAEPEPIALAAVRALADGLPGPRPHAIAMEVVAERRVVGTLVAAGIGLAPRRLVLPAWRLAVAGGPPVVLAPSQGRAGDRSPGLGRIDGGAARRIAAAERGAVVIPAAIPPGLTAIAPGVVVIPTAGLSPGSRVVYVHLADGGEVLFALGVAPVAVNWRELRAPSRWLGQWRRGESREAAFRWLATIRAWQREAPALLVIPGEDAEWFDGHAASRPFAGRFPTRGQRLHNRETTRRKSQPRAILDAGHFQAAELYGRRTRTGRRTEGWRPGHRNG